MINIKSLTNYKHVQKVYCLALIMLLYSVTYGKNIYISELEKAEYYTNVNADSALIVLNNLEEMLSVNNNEKYRTELLILKSYTYRNKQNFDMAYNISKEVINSAEQIPDTLLLIKAYTNYGIMNFVVFNEAESRKYLDKALELSKIMFLKGKTTSSDLLKSYQNIIQHLKRFQKYHEALIYSDTCYNLITRYNLGDMSKAYFEVNKGYFCLKTNNETEALNYLLDAMHYFENIAPDNYKYNHRSYLPTIYSYLGEIYRKQERYKLSEEYFIKSLDTLKAYPQQHNHKPYILEQYAWLLYETGKYNEAIKKLNESQYLTEQYFSAKTLNDSSFQKVRNQYRGELNVRMQELIVNSIEIAKKDKAILRFRIFTIFILSAIITIILIFKIRRTSKKHTVEKKDIIAKQKQATELVKLKNRELTESTLKLIEKEEIIKQLSEELSKNKTQTSSHLLKQISQKSDNMWDDFNSRFKAVNQDFYKKLSEKYPDLSSNDLKICALVKLNFSTKEMSNLLGISNESVQKARHRLRKKLSIDRDTNLTSYISSF